MTQLISDFFVPECGLKRLWSKICGRQARTSADLVVIKMKHLRLAKKKVPAREFLVRDLCRKIEHLREHNEKLLEQRRDYDPYWRNFGDVSGIPIKPESK